MRNDIGFEQAYRAQAFPELVRFGIWLGSTLRRLRQDRGFFSGRPATV